MRGTGHIEQRGDGIWRLRVDVGIDHASGRRRQVSRTVHGSKRFAAQELVRFLNEVEGGKDRGTKAKTVAELVDDWLAQAAGDLEPNTAMEFRKSFDRYLKSRLGAFPLAKLRAWDIDAAYRDLLAHGSKKGGPLAAGTVRKAHTVLTLALDQAVKWTWLTENPARHSSPPAVAKSDPTPPDPAQCRALLETAERLDEDWAMFLRLAAATGARRSELCALRWSVIDLAKGTVTIHRAVIYTDTEVFVREYPKTPAGRRRVAIDAGTVAALRAHRVRQAENALKVGKRPVADAFLFSTNEDGSTPWHPHAVTRRFGRLRAAANERNVRFHDLRHYVATQLLAAGVDPVSVAGRLGHSRPAVTLNVYAHWVPARDEASAEFLGNLLDDRTESQS